MTDEWGEPVEATRKPAHDFNLEPIVVGTFQRTDQITIRDRDTDEARLVNMHRLLGDDGELVDCWGSAMLDDLLRKVAPGSRVRIQFLGSEELLGGRTIKRYEVRLGKPVAAGVNPPDDDIPF